MSTITDVPAILDAVMALKRLSPHGWGMCLPRPAATAVRDITSGRQKSVTLQRLDELAVAAGYPDFIRMALAAESIIARRREGAAT